MSNQLRMELRVGESRPVSLFTLRPGENLSERVKEELEIAAREGNLGDRSAMPAAPSICVYEVDENQDRVEGTVHLFSMSGADVTKREAIISIDEDESSKAILLEGYVEAEDGTETKTNLGVFFDEDFARRVGALWKAGALD